MLRHNTIYCSHSYFDFMVIKRKTVVKEHERVLTPYN